MSYWDQLEGLPTTIEPINLIVFADEIIGQTRRRDATTIYDVLVFTSTESIHIKTYSKLTVVRNDETYTLESPRISIDRIAGNNYSYRVLGTNLDYWRF